MPWAPIIETEFASSEDLVYLNHAGVSPWPRCAAEAVSAFARENYECGPLGYERWLRIESELRERARALLNAASADDIALLKNTSEGLSVVAYGLPWRDGDNIVSTAQEFPSNRIVWESLADRGVELRLAALDGTEDPEGALLALTDRRTRLVTVSSVQYASGLRMDLGRIGAFCRERGIVFCVDAIQSLGALAFDLREVNADVVVADGHKWMMGPEGVALFYTHPDLRDRLRLHQYGWHMVEALGDYDRRDWQVARSARRFECGSPNLLGIHGLHASLGLLLELGMERIEAAVIENTAYLNALISATPGLELRSSRQRSRLSGIVSFGSGAGVEVGAWQRALRDQGIWCAARGGGMRFSPHFYTPRAHLARAVEVARIEAEKLGKS